MDPDGTESGEELGGLIRILLCEKTSIFNKKENN